MGKLIPNAMLTEDFCTYLEYQISRALQNAADEEKSSYWCDGVLLPEYTADYSPGHVLDTGRIVTAAILPKGQYEEKDYHYQLTIKFGGASLRKYISGESLEECVPTTANADWIKLDTRNKTLEVELL